jgi:hypothetical protein
MNEVDNKNKSLDSLLDTVYLRKYGESVDNDPVISYLKNDTLVRYYFNQRKMDKEGSRVIIPEDESTFKISFKEAILEEAIVLFQKDLEGNDIRLSYDDYEDGNYDKSRMLYYTSKLDIPLVLNCNEDGELYFETESKNKTVRYLPSIKEKLELIDGKVKTK